MSGTAEDTFVGYSTGRYHVCRTVRSDLADEIEKYWVGRKNSHIGLQYLVLQDGIVGKGRFIERRDVLLLHGENINVFVDPPDDIHVQPHGGMDEGSPAAIRRATAAAKRAIRRESAFIEHELRFLTEKPWEQVYGMTPEDAVAKIRELGW